MSNSSLFTPALLRTHSFVFFALHETHRIFLRPFISEASKYVSSFFLGVQLSQPYVATGHTGTFISCIFVEIGRLWLFHIFCTDAPITCPLFNLVRLMTTGCCSADSERTHSCCHLLTTVENIDFIPNIPYTLQSGDHPKLSSPLGRAGPLSNAWFVGLTQVHTLMVSWSV